MQSRAFIRSPQVCRIVKAPVATRSMSLFSAPSFMPRFAASPFASLDREIAPFFRMMDDLNRTFDHLSPVINTAARAPAPFQPRFDVREIDGAYELRGELPGVESNNIEVEFADAQTLVIRGRTEVESSSGTPSQQQQQSADVEATEPTTSNTNAVADDAASMQSTSSYQKASVEDEAVAAETTSSTPGQATPAESTTSEQQVATNPEPIQQQQQQQPQQVQTTSTTPRYWVSERRTGSFQRVFNFPTKVDQEAVKASLKNGVLSVVVPKAVAQLPRRITVQ